MNTFHFSRSIDRKDRNRRSRITITSTFCLSIPDSPPFLPSFLLNPSESLSLPPTPPIKFPPRPGDHPGLATTAASAAAAPFAAMFSIAKWCITIEIYHTWSNLVLPVRPTVRPFSCPPPLPSRFGLSPGRPAAFSLLRYATCRRSKSG